jgi:thiamine-monophosphate kinase
MLVNKIGEFGLIERIKKFVKTDSSVVKGIGDDCAVLGFSADKYLLFTCDMIVEGVDFTRRDAPYFIGRKAIASSISDIAACGGQPHCCLVSLGMPKKTSVETIDKIYKGIIFFSRKYNINIVGGDISRSEKIIIDVSMLGIVEKKYLALRNGAKRGDIVFVTGELGGSFLNKHHLEFIPRLKEARFLVKHFKINSMIDISDGLAQDLGHILSQSNAGAVIYEDLIPVSKQARGLDDALYMGEDFELLFTMSQDEANRLLKKNPYRFKPIGKIVVKEYGARLKDNNGNEKIMRPRGFTHF